MTHRYVGASILALVLGWASPAIALTRQAAFEWAPASGPVAGYAVYASINGAAQALVAYVSVPSATLSVESGAFVRVSVAAYDSAGRLGPPSAASDPVRLCPGDFDGDGIVGPADLSDARSCVGQAAEGFCAGADIDLDGAIRLSDMASLIVGADACPPARCPGDFNGDHVIGFRDLAAAKSCFGQAAVGACAAADFNGDGRISMADLTNIQRALGSDTCSF